jgi:hypothetical protein
MIISQEINQFQKVTMELYDEEEARSLVEIMDAIGEKQVSEQAYRLATMISNHFTNHIRGL